MQIKSAFLLMVITVTYNHFAFGQASSKTDCRVINALVQAMQQWKHADKNPPFPVAASRSKSIMGNTILTDGPKYFESALSLPGTVAGEFTIDQEGKCTYLSKLGPYSKKDIDAIGRNLKKQLQSCLSSADWQVSAIKGTYLQMTYRQIDISLTLLKFPSKNDESYWLSFSMIRFTSM